MRPVSTRFLEALRDAHTVAASCELYFPADPATPVEVPIESGQLSLDRTAPIRRTGSVAIPWALDAAADLGVDLRELAFGGYAVLKRGVLYADGSAELVQLGRLRVESVTWKTTDNLAGLELADRMAQVRDEPFVTPFAPPGGAGITRAGALTDGSPIVTGLSTTTDLLIGMTVTAPGLPADRRIQSIDSATQITLTGTAELTDTKDAVYAAGDPTVRGLNTTSDLSLGMVVDQPSGFDFTAGTVIISIDSATEISVNPAPVGGSESGIPTLTFTAPAAATLTFGAGRRIADGAIEIAQEVFGSTIAYRKLHDPPIILDDVYFASDRSQALFDLAKAAAAELYFDALGDFVFAAPSGTTASVWTIDAGATGVLVAADESLDRTGVYNGVLVVGQAAGTAAPVYALVTDDDPTSATRWGGPFGKVARIEQLSAVQTAGQASDAAGALLERRAGLQRSVVLTLAPNPALEPGDVVTIAFPDGRSEQHVVDVIRLGLGPTSSQQIVVRSTFTLARMPLPRQRHRADLYPRRRRRWRTYHGRAAWAELAGAEPARSSSS